MWLIRNIAIALLTAAGADPALSADGAKDATDVDAGRVVYEKCIACHSPERNRTGPLHCGLVGREAGTVEGYEYSDAMRTAAIVWNADTLNRFLEAPLEMIPETSMGFAGLADETERRQLIAWLATLTASSKYCIGAPVTNRSSKHD